MLDFITRRAKELGFCDLGVSKVKPLTQDGERLTEWLSSGKQAKMGYMLNHFEKRVDPSTLVDGAKSIITLLYSYNFEDKVEDRVTPMVSKYAVGVDYHDTIRELLNRLLASIQDSYPDVTGRGFTDSAPIFERSLAVQAGLGWIGKSGSLISKKFGSFVFIAELIINRELPYSKPFEGSLCGSCSACIQKCPTAAIEPNSVVDANRCISYLTIEHKGDIPEEFKGKMGGYIYGCDICQSVCPWNIKASKIDISKLQPIDGLWEFDCDSWNSLSREEFNSRLKYSPLRRTGYNRVMRNLKFSFE